MKILLFTILICFSLGLKGEEPTSIRVWHKNYMVYIPLSSIEYLKINLVTISDSIVDYSLELKGQNLVDSKIYINCPLYEKRGEHVHIKQVGFNVSFSRKTELISYLQVLGYQLVELKDTQFVFNRVSNNQIAIK